MSLYVGRRGWRTFAQSTNQTIYDSQGWKQKHGELSLIIIGMAIQKEAHAGLAQMYVDDLRSTAYTMIRKKSLITEN